MFGSINIFAVITVWGSYMNIDRWGYVQGETPRNLNYLLDSWPLVVQASLLGDCTRNPSVSVYQLVLLWEAMFSISKLFLKTLSKHLPILWLVIYKHICPHQAENSAIFEQKWHGFCVPHSLYLMSPQATSFLFPQMKNSPQRETFCPCRGGETKNGRNTKRHQNWLVQKLFGAVGKKSR